MIRRILSIITLVLLSFLTNIYAAEITLANNDIIQNEALDVFKEAEQLQKEALELYALSQSTILDDSINENQAMLQVFFSYEKGSYFQPKVIEIFVGNTLIQKKDFDETDLIALNKGAVDLIFEGGIGLEEKSISTRVHGFDERSQSIIVSSIDSLNLKESSQRKRKHINLLLKKSIYQPKAEWSSWN